MDIPIQDNCLDCIHNNVCYKSAWQKEPCKDKIKTDYKQNKIITCINQYGQVITIDTSKLMKT